MGAVHKITCVASVPVRFKRKEISRAKNGESAKNGAPRFIFCALPIFRAAKISFCLKRTGTLATQAIHKTSTLLHTLDLLSACSDISIRSFASYATLIFFLLDLLVTECSRIWLSVVP